MIFLRPPAAWALVLLASSQLLAQTGQSGFESIPHADDTIQRFWGPQDGLPDIEITGITQTSDGYLWIAGPHGLTRFDGARFTTIPESSPKPNGATAVLTARDGTLWAAIGQGDLLRRLRTGRFQLEVSEPSDARREMFSLAENAGGDIWSSSSLGGRVLRRKKGKVVTFRLGGGNPTRICAATDGTIWVGSYAHIGFFDGRKFRFLPMGDNGSGQLCTARSGGVWTVFGRNLLRMRENGKSEIVADLSRLGGSAQVSTLYEDREGSLWIGTQGLGLIRFRDGNFERVPTSGMAIGCIYQDRDDNLWVGIRGAGLNRLSPRRFFVRTAPVDRSLNPIGPLNTRVTSVAVDTAGLVWMAQGLSPVCATNASNRAFAPTPGWAGPNGGIFSLNSPPSGGIWLGGVFRHLRLWKNGTLLSDIPLSGALASFLLDGSSNQIWAALKPNKGVYRWRGKDFELLRESADIANPVCMALDPKRRLWVGTTEGRVYRQQDGNFIEAPMPAASPGDTITFLVPDGPDTVWIGRLTGGLYRWHDGRLDKLSAQGELAARELRVLEIEPNGDFWLGTDQGLFRVPRSELEAVLDGRQHTLQTVAYGANSGMPVGATFQFGFLHASTRTPDGHLWFATSLGGLEAIPETSRKAAMTSESVQIEEFLAGGKSLPLPEDTMPIMLPPQPGSVQIRYALPELSSPEQVRFRYRLLGSGGDSWSSGDVQRTATFSSLPPGSYTFEVAATSIDRTPSKAASISFTVQAAWWETPLFRFGCALAGGFAVAALVRAIVTRRMQARMRRIEQEHALERERTRIARDMHDELGASLTHIMLMSEAAATEHALPDINEIAEASRTISSTLDEIVWATNPRNDTLESLISYIGDFSEEYLELMGIQLRLELPAEIPERPVPAEKRHHVLLVVKEALNNIAKYSGAFRVHIRAIVEHDVLRVVIADNGKGFDPGAIASTSNGLLNMRHRMEAIDGKAEIESEVDRGTTITLSVKI